MVKEMITKLVIDYPYINENYKIIAIKSKDLIPTQKQHKKLILLQI